MAQINEKPQSSKGFNGSILNSLSFSRSVVSDSLRPHGLQRARLPCPSPSPGLCSNSCLLSRVMPSNHLIHCHPFLLPAVFPSIRVFSRVSSLLQMVKVLELQHQSFQRIFRAYTNTNTNSC